jgi:glycosyltransferase involved in cell wall biosynthesis
VIDQRPIAILLTPVLPLPGQSGRALRAWDWVCQLNLEHRVHVLVANADILINIPKDYPAEQVWHLATSVAAASRTGRTIGLLCPPLCLAYHRFVFDWRRLANQSLLEDCVRSLRTQSVIKVVVFRLYLHDIAQALINHLPSATAELDMDDFESHTRLSVASSLARMGNFKSAVGWLGTSVQYALLERLMKGHYDKIWVATTCDMLSFHTRLGPKILERPNRVVRPETQAFKHPGDQGTIRLMFVGTLNYPPNEEAVLELVDHILPALRLRMTRPWTIFVIGRHASPQLVDQLSHVQNIEFLPDVPQLSAYYDAAHIVVIPLKAGGGTKLKTLEAFANKRSVVSTGHGVRGLNAVAGEHYLAAETSADFVNCIVKLANDIAFMQHIARSGHQLWKQGFEAKYNNKF